jgi:signal peptidase I
VADSAWRFILGRDPRRTFVRLAVLAVISFITFTWILIPVRAQGISMLPTYESGSFNLVNRLAYTIKTPARGDVVAVQLAGPHVVYIKRIVALPNERVAIHKGVVVVDGRPLDEPYVQNRAPWNLPESRLRDDEYFLVGDNRGMSEGEHDFGRAPRARIIGKVLF